MTNEMEEKKKSIIDAVIWQELYKLEDELFRAMVKLGYLENDPRDWRLSLAWGWMEEGPSERAKRALLRELGYKI